MKKLLMAGAMSLIAGGLIYAAHSYEEVASVHDIMENVQKPAMDSLAAMTKAGGPQNDDDWKKAKANASILAESTQLLLMGSRVKDDVWTDGANRVIDGAKKSMAASDSKNLDAWKTAGGTMGGGCRGCHKVHKPKEEAKK
jgi:cytochrome c556